MEKTACPICRTQNVGHTSTSSNTSEIHCPRCGRYQIQAFAETQLMNSPPAFPPQHILSGLCRNTWDTFGEKLFITADIFKSWAELDKVAKVVVPRDHDVATKSRYLLAHLRRKSRSLADVVTFSSTDLAVGFCVNKQEMLFCLRYLEGLKLAEEVAAPPPRQPQGRQGGGQGGRQPQGGGITFRITATGWAELDAPAVTGESAVAAVACGSDAVNDVVWNQGFSAGIQLAGYAAVRADSREHVGKITDEVVVNMRRATVLVADLTGQNPLSYFEAGLAIGLGKPVFWTCEENEARDKKIWLETRQFVVTTWSKEKLDVFAKRLGQRIEAATGRVKAQP